ncbi:hypothetical protein VKT23_019386 [Stygiomarasmius scandens]|uniref:C2H2-type domain-containing protein n=1 Tax=Marasmiellus scandens TaxID=2682957 RepID=A0ABR1INZ9_9AGAR
MLQCPFPGCIRFFKHPEDRKQHLTKSHKSQHSQLSASGLASPEVQQHIGSLPTVPIEESDPIVPPLPSFTEPPIPSPPPSQSSPTPPSPPNQPRTIRVYHHCLTGDKCDSLGDPLPANAPPDPREVPENPWEPFDGMIGFHAADLLYHKVEMSQSDTDFLLNLWNLSLAKHDDVGPFHDHEAIHEAIDSIKQGSAPWRCFVTVPDTGLPADTPEWKKTEYEVWYCDPETVIQNMLDNPNSLKSLTRSLMLS